ncbi:soluble inorganic pyrophosphatase 1 [Populus alba x Populus x berolinensis]|nr:soluble inorganic pyrophosphatase 1 [Populus alba x Populus x berolinensis]
MEVATDEQFTPIKQDTKKGKLRYYLYNINWNYGLLPQTWEDPSLANAEVEGAFGDNDPVDVVEIGERRGKIGEILKIKPLAALAMIDEGELDWKIVAISLDDPRASLVNDIDDVEKHFPVSPVLSPSSQTIQHHNHLSIPLHVLLPANQISPIK